MKHNYLILYHLGVIDSENEVSDNDTYEDF